MTLDTQLDSKPYKTIIPSLADLGDYVDKELGVSDWKEILQEDINTFGRITEDEQWIHVDEERSKRESPYKTTIAHGFMILAFASKMSYETYEIADVKMGVNYGLDKVRFMSPTPSGGKVRGRVKLLSYEPMDGGAKFKVQITFELLGQEKPVCVAEFLAMVYT